MAQHPVALATYSLCLYCFQDYKDRKQKLRFEMISPKLVKIRGNGIAILTLVSEF